MDTMRKGLFLVLAVLAAGCDSTDTEGGRCIPAEGCDGIVEIAEITEAAEITDFSAQSQDDDRPQPEWCEQGENISYVDESMLACADISILCQPDWRYFSNECGCGCRYVGRPGDYRAL